LFKAIFTSKLNRAIQTLQELKLDMPPFKLEPNTQAHLPGYLNPVFVDDSLLELDNIDTRRKGELIIDLLEQIKRDKGDEFNFYYNMDKVKNNIQNDFGESINNFNENEFYNFIKNFLLDISLDYHCYDTILIVSHDKWINRMIQLLNKSVNQIMKGDIVELNNKSGIEAFKEAIDDYYLTYVCGKDANGK
jgi:broad specificity phosphatase PhoE